MCFPISGLPVPYVMQSEPHGYAMVGDEAARMIAETAKEASSGKEIRPMMRHLFVSFTP